MAALRKPFQGITNIIKFNWHFYLAAVTLMIFLFWAQYKLPAPFNALIKIVLICTFFIIVISLLISYYVYDISNLYSFNWLPDLGIDNNSKIINIHAGFDESSEILKDLYPNASMVVFDFYDPKKHTEPSIKRARKAYPSYPGTKSVSTTSLPLNNIKVDCIFLTLAAHEIRDNAERTIFFTDLKQALKPEGKLVITEHLRDLPNFLAYTIGFFHFYSKKTWLNTFNKSGFAISREIKITPFITSFILVENGDTA
jgi:SAM-dependent methyltransferase